MLSVSVAPFSNYTFTNCSVSGLLTREDRLYIYTRLLLPASPLPSPLALLDRVLLRLTTCEGDEALQAQIDALLCPILLKCPTDSAAVHAKVTSVLKHITEVRHIFPLFGLDMGISKLQRKNRPDSRSSTPEPIHQQSAPQQLLCAAHVYNLSPSTRPHRCWRAERKFSCRWTSSLSS